MLIIRQKQIDTMIMGDEEKFVVFLDDHIKNENPGIEEKYEHEIRKNMIRGGIDKAKSYKFSTAKDITAFVAIMFDIAPNFDEQSDIKAVLDDENTPPENRIDNIRTLLTSEEAREEAEKNYDETAWTFEYSPKDMSDNN